jgi:hypothetical protein
MSQDDGSRIEAAEAGVHAEQRELDDHGAADTHVDAVEAVPTAPGSSHHPATGHDEDAHGAGGHGADPNAGVLVATPPTPAWVMTAVGIAAVTIGICVVLAVILADKVG